jgi:hypothetical protein
LIVDRLPRGPRDPNRIHGAIWEQVQDDPFHPSPDQPLTLVAYECDFTTRAYIELLAVGQPPPRVPERLEPALRRFSWTGKDTFRIFCVYPDHNIEHALV